MKPLRLATRVLALAAFLTVPLAIPLAMLSTTVLGGCAASLPAPVLLTLPSAALQGGRPDALATLPALAALTATPPAAPLPPLPQLALRRVTLPEYLVSRRVRFRTNAATLAEWPNTYWAERIEIGVAREFAAALRQQLPGWTVCDGNCGEPTPLRSLEIELLSMDYLRSSQTLHARARITLRSHAVGAAAGSQRTFTDELGIDLPVAADTAQAHAQAIAVLIQQVAHAAALRVEAARS